MAIEERRIFFCREFKEIQIKPDFSLSSALLLPLEIGKGWWGKASLGFNS